MTKKEIVDRLLDLAKHQGSHRDPFVCCDLVHQENLVKIQDALMSLIEDLDKAAAVKALPFMYARQESQ
jgi:hypothetical protein